MMSGREPWRLRPRPAHPLPALFRRNQRRELRLRQAHLVSRGWRLDRRLHRTRRRTAAWPTDDSRAAHSTRERRHLECREVRFAAVAAVAAAPPPPRRTALVRHHPGQRRHLRRPRSDGDGTSSTASHTLTLTGWDGFVGSKENSLINRAVHAAPR